MRLKSEPALAAATRTKFCFDEFAAEPVQLVSETLLRVSAGAARFSARKGIVVRSLAAAVRAL